MQKGLLIMKKTIFTGSGVAIVTPMNKDFSVNYNELGRLIDWHIEKGTDAIIICGTTGECSTLSDDEHVECIRFAVCHTDGRVPVIAGTGSNETAYAVRLAKEAKAAGADGQLQVTPYYNKTSQRGLVRHFTTIADATDLPVILYNVPGRTGVNIKPETYLELCRHPNIVATKEANGDVSSTVQTISLCGEQLAVYSGEDALIIPIMSLGGKGVISVIANVVPDKTHELCRLFLTGRAEEAGKLQIELSGLTDAMFCDVNPIPVNHALNLMGWKVGLGRMPLIELTDKQAMFVEAQLMKLGLI
jgi:4-hydroxy-tetrahydrodipicolinate synthase